jgi:hypothetical protein
MSGEQPLTIACDMDAFTPDDDERREFEIKAELMTDEHARTRLTHLRFSKPEFFNLVPWKSVMQNPYPLLETLAIVAIGTANAQALPPLTARNFPVLSKLMLNGIYPSWEESELPSLRLLDIKFVGGSFEDLQDFVSRSPHLPLIDSEPMLELSSSDSESEKAASYSDA